MENEYSLYNDEILLEFDSKKHCYTVDGKEVNGVTSILGIIDKPAVNRWKITQCLDFIKRHWKAGISYDEYTIWKILSDAETAHELVSDKAKVIGSIIHSWIEYYISAKVKEDDIPDFPINKDARVGCEAFVKWEENKNVTWLGSEQIVYSKKYNYAGTFDGLGVWDDKLTLCDFKSSKAIYPEYFVQASTYAKAYEEEHDRKIDRVSILKIPKGDRKRPSIYEKSNEDVGLSIDELFGIFEAALKIYNWKY